MLMKSNIDKNISHVKTCCLTTMLIYTCSWESNTISRFNFIYILQYNANFFEEKNWNPDENKSSDKISQLKLQGKQSKHNVDKEDILLICILGLPCLLILFLNILTSPDVNINLRHVL